MNTPGQAFNYIQKLRQTILKKGDHVLILGLAGNAIEANPSHAESAIELLTPEYFHDYASDAALNLWKKLLKYRDDLAETFLKQTLTMVEQKKIFVMFASSTANMFKYGTLHTLIGRAKKIDHTIEYDIIHKLLEPAMVEAMILGRRVELFSSIVEHPVILTGRWKDGRGEGNALYLWAEVHRDNDAHGDPKNNGLLILKKLLNAGVAVEDPVELIFDFKPPMLFNSTFDMVAWRLDQKEQYEPVIDTMLDAGINWGDLAQGDGIAARHIRNHPVFKSYERKEALGQFISSEPGANLKPRM